MIEFADFTGSSFDLRDLGHTQSRIHLRIEADELSCAQPRVSPAVPSPPEPESEQVVVAAALLSSSTRPLAR